MKRALWWGFLGLLAAAVTIAQLDRASAFNPVLMLSVPAPLRSEAQLADAALVVETGTPAAALQETRKLVRHRPIPSDHLFLLAIARARAGDGRGFEDAFRIATTRGWRSEPVQLFAAKAAIDRNNAGAAANRLAALWALGSQSDQVRPLTKSLLDLPGGPEAFAQRLESSEVLKASFLNQAPSFLPKAILERLAAASANRGSPLPCGGTREWAGMPCDNGRVSVGKAKL